MQVAVVRERQSLQQRKDLLNVGDDAGRFAANQLQHVRVPFLRHDRRTGCVRIGQLEKPKLRRTPQNPLFSPAREVDRDQREIEDGLSQKIAVARNVEAVRGDSGEPKQSRGRLPINGQTRSRESRRAERQHVDSLQAVGESLAVALELLAIGQPVVSGHHGLSALHVREAGEYDIGVSLTPIDEGSLEFDQQSVEHRQRIAHVQLEVRRHLIVPAARRVQLAPHVTDTGDQGRLDVHVDVFEFRLPRHLASRDLLANVVECLDDLAALVVGEQPDFREHSRVSLRSPNINRRETTVEADRLRKLLDPRIRPLVKRTTPSFARHETFLPKQDWLSAIRVDFRRAGGAPALAVVRLVLFQDSLIQNGEPCKVVKTALIDSSVFRFLRSSAIVVAIANTLSCPPNSATRASVSANFAKSIFFSAA